MRAPDSQTTTHLLLLNEPLSYLERDIGSSEQDDVYDGLEGIGGEAFGGRDKVAGRIVDHAVGKRAKSLHASVHRFFHLVTRRHNWPTKLF